MKTSHIIKSAAFLLAALLLTLSSCQKDQVAGPEPDTFIPTTKQRAVVQASNEFGFNLLRKTIESTGDSNFCISPMSISTALGMTWCGAAGNTADQMEDILGYGGMSSDDIKKAYQGLLNYLLSAEPKARLEYANSIWYEQNFYVEPSFIQDNQQYFSAGIYPADFTAPQTVGLINQWVSNATHGKITEIIQSIPPQTVMYLINALYFKGEWTTSFDASKTHQAIFQSPSGNISVEMMEKQDKINVLRNEHFEAVKLPYGSGRFSFIAMMPKNGKSIPELADELENYNWNEWIQDFSPQDDFLLYFPRFKLAFEKNLNDMLIEMGMEDAFSPGLADFSGINATTQLFINGVKHKTYIDVNEEGTEAAAVTSISLGFGMPDMLAFNREFLYFIVEEETGFILFSGRVSEPEYS